MDLKTIAHALMPYAASRGFPAGKAPFMIAHPGGMRPRFPQQAAGQASIIADKPFPRVYKFPAPRREELYLQPGGTSPHPPSRPSVAATFSFLIRKVRLMIEVIPDLPDHVLGVTAKGSVTGTDYESVIIHPGREETGSTSENQFALPHRERLHRHGYTRNGRQIAVLERINAKAQRRCLSALDEAPSPHKIDLRHRLIR